MQVVTDEGRALDARFHLQRVSDDLSLVFQSRGGTGVSPDERNTEYNAGLEVLLARLSAAGAVIEDALVDSERLRELDPDQRRIEDDELRYPLSISDAKALRRALGSAMARVGRKPDAKGAENSTKRILLRLRWPGGGSVQEIAERLRRV